MTPVNFHFIAPDGNPIANAQVQILMPKGGFDATGTEIAMPSKMLATTDENGKMTVELYAVEQHPYTVILWDSTTKTTFREHFYVPDSVDPVELRDIIQVPAPTSMPYDEAAIQTITQVKTDVQVAEAGAVAAQDAAEAAQTLSEAARDASQAAQGLSEDARDASQTAQGLSETAQTASEAARDLSLQYRNTASTHKDAADASATAAAASEAAADADATATAADRVQTGLDRTATGNDAAATAADAAATAADRVATDEDTTATAADRTQTGLDADATAADRVQTGLDRTAASDSAAAASASETAAAGSESAAQTAQGLSEAARDASQTAQGLSETARDKSQDWAELAEDLEVEVGKYSSLHHRAKSEDAQAASEAAQALSEGARDASEAARDASQTAQGLSETAQTAAEAARDLTLQYRDTAETHKDAASASEAAAAASEAAAAGSESAAAASETAAADTLAVFQDQYWGAYASEPSLSPTGQVADLGDLYFDTGVGAMKVYTASGWVDATTTVEGVYDLSEQTNVAGETVFTLGYDVDLLQVLYNGVQLAKADFTATDGSTVTLADPVADAADVISFMRWGAVTTSSFLQTELDAVEAAANAYADQAEVDAKAYTDVHEGRVDNPHAVTKTQVGLGSVDNVAASALRDRSTHTGTQTLATISDAGSAAARDVGTAANQLLEFGAFGIGDSMGIPGGDYNNATVPGFYSGPGVSALNDPPSPSDNLKYGGLIVVSRGENGVHQLGFFRDDGIATRDSGDSGSTWSNWNIHYLPTNIVRPVSQSGGTPTGGIIEKGSNANGEYTKFADGTMICSLSKSVGPDFPNSLFSGQWGYTDDKTWVYPASFSGVPVVSGTGYRPAADSRKGFVHFTSFGSTQGIFQVMTSNPTSLTFYALLTAVGRWY